MKIIPLYENTYFMYAEPVQMFEKLEAELEQAKTVEKRMRIYHAYADKFLYQNHQLAQACIDAGMNLANEQQLNPHKAYWLYKQILLYSILSQTKKQFDVLLEFAAILKQLENEDLGLHYCLIALTLTILATTFDNINTSEHTLSVYLKSLAIFEEQERDYFKQGFNTNFKILLYEGIAFVYLQLNELEKSKSHLEIATFFVEKSKQIPEKINSYYRWAFYYWKAENIGLCVEYAHKSITLSNTEAGHTDCKDIQNMYLYIILGIVHIEPLQNYPQALIYFQKALELCKYFDNILNIATVNKHISRIYMLLEDWKQAATFAHTSTQAYLKYSRKQSTDNVALAQELLGLYASQAQQNNQPFFWEPSTFEKTVFKENNGHKFYRYISTHCKNHNLQVEDIAKYFNMSRHTLNRRIQKFFGLSVQKFIIFLRLQKAYQLLSETNKSVSEVAEMVGFEHIPYFGICFKKQYGILPSKLKQLQK